MSKKTLKNKVFSGLFWAFGERILAQGISFILSIILARLLLPQQYGMVTMVLVFINIANVFVSNGFGESLIQKKNVNETDYSTVFFCSIGVAVVLYILLFISAPYIAKFYDISDLCWVLRILALKLPVASVNTIQHAYVQKNMLFRKFFFSTLGGTLISGIIGVLMAYSGFGVWALVAQYLSNSIIDTLVLSFTIPWKPQFVFSKQSAKTLIGYGWKLTAASLINTVYCELRSLIIGKKYSTTDLAYYNKGNHLPSLAIINIDASIGKVVFPAMAMSEGKPSEIKLLGRRAMKITAYIIFPIMAGLIAVGEPLIRILLTNKWISCVPYLRLACLYWACQPIQTTNWQVIKAMGRSDLCVKLEIIKKIIGVAMIIASMPFGVMAMAISNTLFAIISMVINILPNEKLIGYSLKEQIYDLFPSLLLSVIMGGLVYAVSWLQINDLIMLILQVSIGILFYILLSYLLKNDSFLYLLNMLKTKMQKK